MNIKTPFLIIGVGFCAFNVRLFNSRFMSTNRGGLMFGISKEWWILYIILIALGVVNLYWKLGAIRAYDQFYSLLNDIKDKLTI